MVALDRAAPAVPKTDDRVPVLVDAAAYHGTYHGVQAGAVTPTCEHADSHGGNIPERWRPAGGPSVGSDPPHSPKFR